MSIPVSALQNLTELQTPADEIQWRDGPGGKQLAYVDARYVMRVLDTLIGPANWQRRHAIGADGRVGCDIGIFVEFDSGPEWVWKGDGAGETDIEGEKGSFSDSFKRAAVSWGVGRDLYSMKPQSSGQSAPRAATQPTPARAGVGVGSTLRRPPASDGPLPDDGEPIVSERCPVHDLAWVLQPSGNSKSTGKWYPAFWKCGYKPGRGQPWCQQKPSEAWEAAHELDGDDLDELPF